VSWLRALLRLVEGALGAVALGLIRLYQVLLSPFLGRACRYQPTCSRYTHQAIRRFGFFRGGWIGAKRIARCHPWGNWGPDPVPERP
jgi:putative membrane protein insertion efficiency factor